MGCESCSNSGGLPAGCKNNGACGVNGCGKLDVFDWLSGMELPMGQKIFDVVEVRFKNSRKGFYRTNKNQDFHVGDVVVVESSPGYDVGIVSLTGELVKLQMEKKKVKDNLELRKIQRIAEESDISKWQESRQKEKDTMLRARTIALNLELKMKISDVEYQGDGKKATFFYTADERVDFRELIRKFAEDFHVRIEMKQIGMRQESGRLGGIGSCGRELCCSTWLTDFRSVSTSAARYQQLSLNPQKLAGQCGKLKCCLNFELDQYLEAIKGIPPANTKLKTEAGLAFHFKTDIFKRVMYFIYENEVGGSPIALPVETVDEIVKMNKNGEFPMSLKDFSIEEEETEEELYANVVGQDSLTRFDKEKRGRRKNKRRKGGSTQGQGNKPGGQKRNNRRKPKAKTEGAVEKSGANSGQKGRPPRSKKSNNSQANKSSNPNQSGGKKKGPNPNQPSANKQGGKPKPNNRRNKPKGPKPNKPSDKK